MVNYQNKKPLRSQRRFVQATVINKVMDLLQTEGFLAIMTGLLFNFLSGGTKAT